MNVFDRTRAVFQNSSAVFWALGSKSAEESVQILPGLNQLSLVGWTRANEKKEKKRTEQKKKKREGKRRRTRKTCARRDIIPLRFETRHTYHSLETRNELHGH